MFIQIAASCLLIVFLVALRQNSKNKSRLPLPPGPKPLPFVGNLFQFPKKQPWKTLTKWRETYGDIVYINDLGGPTIILNTHKVCSDLLDKRSSIYSDRPRQVMFNELMNFSWQFVLMPYSAEWRQHRRLFHQFFNENASKNYCSIQEECIHAFLRNILQVPERFADLVRLNFGESILRILYNIKAEGFEDEYINLVERTVLLSVAGLNPALYPVNIFPSLRRIPSWLPGGGFHKDAAEGRVLSRNIRDLPYNKVQQDRINSQPGTSVLAMMLEKCEDEKGNDPSVTSGIELAKNCAAIAYTAGADTSLSSTLALFSAFANNPHVQRLAQAELDRVVGTDRLPTFDDMSDLPYCCAIVKEILRYHTVLPMSMPHCVTQDDIYEGYFIPKGATVLSNVWSILHDPEVYADPLSFNPSRWLVETPEGVQFNNSIPDPDIATFGSGRRICPGRYVARNALFITVTNVLACFNISPLDDNGKPADKVKEGYTENLLIYPIPFKVSIVPRSDKAMNLVMETAN